MKFLHTADLHLGKVLYDFSMIEDQKYILEQMIEIAKREKVDAIVIAGDIYDRAIPPADAVMLLDRFLTEVSSLNIAVLIAAGNHDCGERLGFGRAVFQKQNIFIAGKYEEKLLKIQMKDAYGDVVFVLFPFVKPAVTGNKTSGQSVEHVLAEFKEEADFSKRHVIISHFFVTDGKKEPEFSGGENSVYVGGIDNVDAGLFQEFDYTALGHIHRSQKIGKGQCYYAGSPLKYSFSEWRDEKSVKIVSLGKKGEISVENISLCPLHEMRILKGEIEALLEPSIVQAEGREDYLQVFLTNREELIDPIGRLRSVYPNVMQLLFTKNEPDKMGMYDVCLPKKTKGIAEMFREFYTLVRDEELDEGRQKIIRELTGDTEGDKV